MYYKYYTDRCICGGCWDSSHHYILALKCSDEEFTKVLKEVYSNSIKNNSKFDYLDLIKYGEENKLFDTIFSSSSSVEVKIADGGEAIDLEDVDPAKLFDEKEIRSLKNIADAKRFEIDRKRVSEQINSELRNIKSRLEFFKTNSPGRYKEFLDDIPR